ncbi:unnamed protein product, partial [Prorocentrum cordatum]
RRGRRGSLAALAAAERGGRRAAAERPRRPPARGAGGRRALRAGQECGRGALRRRGRAPGALAEVRGAIGAAGGRGVCAERGLLRRGAAGAAVRHGRRAPGGQLPDPAAPLLPARGGRGGGP